MHFPACCLSELELVCEGFKVYFGILFVGCLKVLVDVLVRILFMSYIGFIEVIITITIIVYWSCVITIKRHGDLN